MGPIIDLELRANDTRLESEFRVFHVFRVLEHCERCFRRKMGGLDCRIS